MNVWNWFKADSAPQLEKLSFAVPGFGDNNYSDFCGASKKFDDCLVTLRAKRLAPRGVTRLSQVWRRQGRNLSAIHHTRYAVGKLQEMFAM